MLIWQEPKTVKEINVNNVASEKDCSFAHSRYQALDKNCHIQSFQAWTLSYVYQSFNLERLFYFRSYRIINKVHWYRNYTNFCRVILGLYIYLTNNAGSIAESKTWVLDLTEKHICIIGYFFCWLPLLTLVPWWLTSEMFIKALLLTYQSRTYRNFLMSEFYQLIAIWVV